MSGKARFDPENYEGVEDRIMAFRKDHPIPGGRIVTIPMHTAKSWYWEAQVWIGDVMCANGHSLDSMGQASGCEKTETGAIGRALRNAGYSTKPGASREEMENYGGQLDRGAAVHGDGGNGPASAPQATRTNESRPTGVIPPKGKQNAPQGATRPPEAGAATVDRAAFRPSYVAVIKKAEDMVEQGKGLDELTEYFKARKKGMNDGEYADSLSQFGRLKLAITARDAALVAEANDEYNAQTEADMAAEF